MKRFEDRTVVITGASRGIGKGIAKRFAEEGANLVLAANEPSIDEVAEEFRASGAQAVSYLCDVTNKAEVETLYDKSHVGKLTSQFRTPESSRSRKLKICRRTIGTRSWR